MKRELLLYSSFQNISSLLYQEPEHPYRGHVSCIAVHRFKSANMIFVGNSSGYIRAFCMNSQTEKKPLYDIKVGRSPVESIDITSDGKYLIAAHQEG